MKIAVMNFSGNVGKSTVARHLLAPRIDGAQVIAVETINSDGSDDEAYKGRQFGELQEELLLLDAAVVDVGASNVESFLSAMAQYRNAQEDFDFFVVPTVPKAKQLRDTISTIEALSDLGVPAKKIRVVFNQVEADETVERLFAPLIDYQAQRKNFTLRPDAVMHINDIYARLGNGNEGIREVLNDSTDYKEKIKTASNVEERLHFAQLVSIKRLAAGVDEELNAVFKTLLK
ncbi:StbB [Xanthomonas arboricola pv. corylina]|uniref:StbB family protein n=1 Tax=Xanthomonas arboricola TaxID=56448 RepID=UPI000CEEFB47|nr:StbB family protein [Xanthomonas arboricola]PPU05228.1 StbB [Xanthomonas arboricola pv. corylina]